MSADGPWDPNNHGGRGGRHQHADWCVVDANTGNPTKVLSITGSKSDEASAVQVPAGRGSRGHTFDVRTTFDGKDFIQMELSDTTFGVSLDLPLQRVSQDTDSAANPNRLRLIAENAALTPARTGNDHFMELGDIASTNDGGYSA